MSTHHEIDPNFPRASDPVRSQFETWFRQHPCHARYSLHMEREEFDGQRVYQWMEVQLAYDAFCSGHERGMMR